MICRCSMFEAVILHTVVVLAESDQPIVRVVEEKSINSFTSQSIPNPF